MLKFVSRWGPALAVMLIIYSASAQPKGSTLMPDFGGWLDLLIKKSAHLLVYALLGVCFLRGLRGNSPGTRGALILAALLTLAFAVSDEYHQTFVASREGKWQDVVIDTAGASIALILRQLKQSLTGASPSLDE
jgi:VanZ family protein